MNRIKSSIKKCKLMHLWGKKRKTQIHNLALQLYMGKELDIVPTHKLNICQQHVAAAKEANAILDLAMFGPQKLIDLLYTSFLAPLEILFSSSCTTV